MKFPFTSFEMSIAPPFDVWFENALLQLKEQFEKFQKYSFAYDNEFFELVFL